ncbi:hypothetical protein B0H63DRAFT_109383 [Podospora didyma]|uniref:RecA family profile 1 domain-containing protein n=1 Tax=Podospora didyma TaxID=330526 RepID=A0AAE0U481_9PEZI|nr:hypothetical protein B0H63DRAFT_109383 [Podospora didyma]
MDYHAIHGRDVSSFDLPSTHRLPTVSAAQALNDFQGDQSNFVPTGLSSLDASLGAGLDTVVSSPGGIQKGHVTEIWGPPGAGKTAFGGVVWVDGFHYVSSERLRSVASPASAEAAEEPAADPLDAFTHYTCPSLAHLIALLCRPTASCIPSTTSLVVVDSLSALVNHAFPKTLDPQGKVDVKGKKGPSMSARRLQVLQHIVGSLQKLAATRDLAIVILTQCASKMQAERGAALIPAINASVWEQGISTRLVLFRDWAQDDSESRALHFVGIQKLNGKASTALVDGACAFRIAEVFLGTSYPDERGWLLIIQQAGLVSVECDNTQLSGGITSTSAPKRKLGETDFEIADSEDEDYGWEDDEDAIPPMPSQWQGSEDILLQPPESDEESNLIDEDTLDNQQDDDLESVVKESDHNLHG